MLWKQIQKVLLLNPFLHSDSLALILLQARWLKSRCLLWRSRSWEKSTEDSSTHHLISLDKTWLLKWKNVVTLFPLKRSLVMVEILCCEPEMLSLMKPSSRNNIYLMIGFSSRKNMAERFGKRHVSAFLLQRRRSRRTQPGGGRHCGSVGKAGGHSSREGTSQATLGAPQAHAPPAWTSVWGEHPPQSLCSSSPWEGPAALQLVQWQMVKPTGHKAWPYMSPYQPRWERAWFGLHLQYFKKQNQTKTVSSIDHLHYFIISLISSRMSDGWVNLFWHPF